MTPISTEAAPGLAASPLLPQPYHNPHREAGSGTNTRNGGENRERGSPSAQPQTHPHSAQRAARPPSLRYASSVGERRAAQHCPLSLRNLRRADRGGRGGRRRRSGGSAAAPEGGRAGSRSEPGWGRWGEGSRGSRGSFGSGTGRGAAPEGRAVAASRPRALPPLQGVALLRGCRGGVAGGGRT